MHRAHLTPAAAIAGGRRVSALQPSPYPSHPGGNRLTPRLVVLAEEVSIHQAPLDDVAAWPSALPELTHSTRSPSTYATPSMTSMSIEPKRPSHTYRCTPSVSSGSASCWDSSRKRRTSGC